MELLGGHLPELVIVLVVILIIWGPGKLPDIGTSIGRGIREFRKASAEAPDPVTGSTPPAAPSQQTSLVETGIAPAPALASEPIAEPADAATHQQAVSG